MKYILFRNLKNQVLEPISYYMKDFNKDFYMDMHQHAYFEIMYAYKGNFLFKTYENNDPKLKKINSYEINTGQFVFVDAMTYHKIKVTTDDVIIYNIELEIKDVNEYNPFNVNYILPINYERLIKYSGLKTIAEKDKFVILNDIEQVEPCLRNLILALFSNINSLEQALNVQCLLLTLFMEMSKCANNMVAGTLSYIKKANNYILKNFTSKTINIDEIANYVGINKAYLQRQFKKYTNQTILTTINQLRVQKATQLLKTSSFTINDIAQLVGFNDKTQLNYQFKRFLGVSPSVYRRTHMNNEVDHHYHFYVSNAIPEDD